MEKDFQVIKNIKDLEVSRLLNSTTNYTVIISTFVITMMFSEIVALGTKFVLALASGLALFYLMKNYNYRIESKIREIKNLK